MDEHLSIERKEGVGYVTLNRPPVNALTHDLLDSLVGSVMELSDDSSVSVVVLRSGLQKYFSAGMDLKAMEGRPDPLVNEPGDSQKQVRDAGFRLMECPTPIIAAVNGYAVGMGFMIPTLCDIVVAARSAQFGMPEVRFALGGAGHMSRILPPALVRYIMLTGKRLTAEHLERVGAISLVVDDKDLGGVVESLASDMAEEIHPHLLRNLKLSLLHLKDLDDIRYRYALEHAWGGRVRAELGDAASSADWLARLKQQ